MHAGSQQDKILPVALSFGLAIAVLVWGTAHISGGHLNPAVTLSMVLMGKMPWRRAARFVAAQMLGGVVGAVLVHFSYSYIYPNPAAVASNHLTAKAGGGAGFLLEFLGTFLLVFTVHTTAVDPRSAAKNAAPLAIGLSVFLAHVLLIPVTGCGINPARSFGPAFVGYLIKTDGFHVWNGARQAWIYYVGPLLGALGAAVVCGAGLDTDKENWSETGKAKRAADDNAKLRLPRGETELTAV